MSFEITPATHNNPASPVLGTVDLGGITVEVWNVTSEPVDVPRETIEAANDDIVFFGLEVRIQKILNRAHEGDSHGLASIAIAMAEGIDEAMSDLHAASLRIDNPWTDPRTVTMAAASDQLSGALAAAERMAARWAAADEEAMNSF